MARYTGPVCRLCRRERMKLFLKGAKCDTMKCPIERRPYPPGQHGRGRIREQRVPAPAAREAEGAPHLRPAREAVPQPLRRGEPARRASPARTCCACSSCASTTSCSAPASRPSRNQARQFVRHGHVLGQRQAGDDPVVPGAQGRRRRAARQGAEDDRASATTSTRSTAPCRSGSRSTADEFKATVRDLPLREQIDVPVREQLIVELYSK